MRETFVLDTNVWIGLLKRRAPTVRARLDSLEAAQILLCSVVWAELLHGAEKYSDTARRQRDLRKVLGPYQSLPFDDAAAESYAAIRHDLESKGTPIGPNDLLIAAICVQNGATLVTGNTREFRRVSGLRVEDWEGAVAE